MHESLYWVWVTYTNHPLGFNHTLLCVHRLCPWNTVGSVGRSTFQGQRRGWGAWLPGSLGEGINQWSHPLDDLLQKFVTNPQHAGCLLQRMPSTSVTTNCIIPLLGGICTRQADYNMKWIFPFSGWWQFSTWSAALKVMWVSGNGCVYIMVLEW